jgi:hypothetical protein
MQRTRNTDSGPCVSLNLGEHAWKTNFTQPELSASYWQTPFLYIVPNGYSSYSSTIVDDSSLPGHQAEKPCLHVQETNEFDSTPVRLLNGNSGDTNIPLRALHKPDIDELANSPLGAALGTEIPWNNLAFKAWQSMRPRIKSAVSSINFLIELKDLKSWSRVGNALQRIRGLSTPSKFNLSRKSRQKWAESLPYTDISYRMPKGRLKMLKDIARRLAGAHLEASFAVVPLISDIVETYVKLGEVEYKLNALKRYAGRKQKRRYMRYLHEMSAAEAFDSLEGVSGEWVWLETISRSWPPGYDTEFRPLPRYYRKWRWIQAPMYHAMIEYKYSVHSMGDTMLKISAYLDALGLQLNPNIIWNAIPFSFLVDWVVDVSGFLSSFSRDNITIIYQEVSLTHSVSYHSELECSIDMLNKDRSLFFPEPTWFFDEYKDPHSMGTVYRGTRRFYERRVVEDPRLLFPTPTAGLPNEKQLLLSGSLLISLGLGGHSPSRSYGR